MLTRFIPLSQQTRWQEDSKHTLRETLFQPLISIVIHVFPHFMSPSLASLHHPFLQSQCHHHHLVVPPGPYQDKARLHLGFSRQSLVLYLSFMVAAAAGALLRHFNECASISRSFLA